MQELKQAMDAIKASGDGVTKIVKTIDQAKFRRLVLPGYTIEYHMTKKAHKKNMWWYRGEARVADQVVAEAVVGAMVVGE